MKQSVNSVFVVVVVVFLCVLFLRIFYSFGDVTIAVEGLQNFTYAPHSWPLSSEGSLACHTFCDTRHPLMMVISGDP